MIEPLKPQWNREIMKIWLDSNTAAHDFIQPEYWQSQYNYVAEVLPQSEVLVYTKDNTVLGFIGLEEEYIAGIFVATTAQGKGIGKQLLDAAKEKHDTLTLGVYEKNEGARKFYHREGFVVTEKNMDTINNEAELAMKWTK